MKLLIGKPKHFVIAFILLLIIGFLGIPYSKKSLPVMGVAIISLLSSFVSLTDIPVKIKYLMYLIFTILAIILYIALSAFQKSLI